jgi:hypothetical protein
MSHDHPSDYRPSQGEAMMHLTRDHRMAQARILVELNKYGGSYRELHHALPHGDAATIKVSLTPGVHEHNPRWRPSQYVLAQHMAHAHGAVTAYSVGLATLTDLHTHGHQRMVTVAAEQSDREAADKRLTDLMEKAADLHAGQQAMPDEGALEEHRRLIREAYDLGREHGSTS